MIDGIYSAVFESNKNMVGCGVAIFSGNAIHGGGCLILLSRQVRTR
jgi:hypothetical protein